MKAVIVVSPRLTKASRSSRRWCPMVTSTSLLSLAARASSVVSVLLLFAIVSSPALAIDEYFWDDNSGDSGWGVVTATQPDRSFAWLNHFVIQPPPPPPPPAPPPNPLAPQMITAIRVAFGGPPSSNPIPDGTPVSLYLWADTDNDARPYNSAGLGEPVLASTTGLVANSGTNLFNTYTLPVPVTLFPGASIFAGAIVNYSSGQHTVGRLDEHGLVGLPPVQSPYLQSWVAEAAGDFSTGAGAPPVNPFDLSAAQIPPDLVSSAFSSALPTIPTGSGDGWWMIRLNATVVPEPSGAMLMLAGLGISWVRRRRKLEIRVL